MSKDLQALITAVLARAPQWNRQGLLPEEPAAKVRADETLPGMIERAIRATVAD